MDALVLCGGFATRLEPITLFVPKPLLPIGGRPILDYIVDDLADAPEVNRIIISTNMKFAEQFRYWANNKSASGIRKKLELVVEPALHNGEKFGAIKGIRFAIEKAGVADDLIIIAGDNFYSSSVSEAIKGFAREGRKPTVCVHDVGSLGEASRFGIVKMESSTIKEFEEKPVAPTSTMASTGIYIYPKEALARFEEYLAGQNNPDAPGFFLKWLIGKEEVRGIVQKGEWFDIGNIDTYSKLCAQFNGRAASSDQEAAASGSVH